MISTLKMANAEGENEGKFDIVLETLVSADLTTSLQGDALFTVCSIVVFVLLWSSFYMFQWVSFFVYVFVVCVRLVITISHHISLKTSLY